MTKKTIVGLLALALVVGSCTKKEPEVKRTPNPEYKAVTVNAKAKPAFEAMVAELNEVTKYDDVAVKGQTGKLGKRYVNAKGVETVQVIKKGLIGGLQLNKFNEAAMKVMQAQDGAARKAVLDNMVKYLLGDLTPKTKKEYADAGNAFGKYMVATGSTSGKFKDIDKQIYAAFDKAYANVDNKEVFNATLFEITGLVSKVVAVRGVYYISGYLSEIRKEFEGEAVHELSEGLGFIYSLQFAFNHKTMGFYLSADEAQKFATINLWDEAADKSGNSFLDQEAKKIAGMFGFEVADALVK